MSIKSQFKSDAAKVTNGVWFPYEANSDGSIPRFLLARISISNPKYLKAVQDKAQRNGDKTLTVAEEEAQSVENLADAVVLNWENFQPNDDGTNLDYSRENVIAIFGDPDWNDLKIDIRTKALDLSNYRTEALKDAAKK